MTKRRFLIVTCVGIVMLASIATLYVVLGSGPSVGTVRKTNQLTASRTDQVKETKDLMGQYFKLQYPGAFGEPVGSDQIQTGVQEQFTLLEPRNPGYTRVVIVIRTMEAGGLPEESGYAMRHMKPQQYTESTMTIGQHETVLMMALDQAESVLYIQKAPLLASIAITSTESMADTEAIGRELVRTFAWQ